MRRYKILVDHTPKVFPKALQEPMDFLHNTLGVKRTGPDGLPLVYFTTRVRYLRTANLLNRRQLAKARASFKKHFTRCMPQLNIHRVRLEVMRESKRDKDHRI